VGTGLGGRGSSAALDDSVVRELPHERGVGDELLEDDREAGRERHGHLVRRADRGTLR
jgi:hypothetical protein